MTAADLQIKSADGQRIELEQIRASARGRAQGGESVAENKRSSVSASPSQLIRTVQFSSVALLRLQRRVMT